MEFYSPAFFDNEKMPADYTCDGKNVNPPLQFSGVNTGAKSLVLIVDDPDAPAGSWTHWVVFNLPPQLNFIGENQAPAGVLGINSWGETKYNGPCPPSGQHRYFFKLYALDIVLDLPQGATRHEVEKAMTSHVVDKAEFIGMYNR